MLAKTQKEFINLFRNLEEPREDNKLLYPLDEILFLVISAVLSGAESWRNIVKYGKTKLSILQQFFPYQNGIPSRFTIMRFFSILNKKKFESWLTLWANKLIHNFNNELVAIDGKAIKGAKRHAPTESPVYLLNAFATKHGLVIGQQTIGKKENEITAIPELLDKLSITGAVVSIDAIGCQKKIAAKIREKEADYFLTAKINQKKLFHELEDFFSEEKLNANANKFTSYKTNNVAHGRIEERTCYSSEDISWIKLKNPDWKDLKSVCMVKASRTVKGVTTIENRYYISSTDSNAEKHLFYSRNHWAIENNLHWVLDVVLSEDGCHVRKNNAPENMGTIRKIVFNIVKKFKTRTNDSSGIPGLRLMAGWDDGVATQILSELGR